MLEVRRRSGLQKETSDYFKFPNRSLEKKVFKIQEFNGFFWEINDLTSTLFEFRQSCRDKLLALYLGLLPE